jgi:hypothetical protein
MNAIPEKVARPLGGGRQHRHTDQSPQPIRSILTVGWVVWVRSEIAEREEVSARYVRRLMRLAFLAPEIVEAIAAGNQPPELTAEAWPNGSISLSSGPRKKKRSVSPSPLTFDHFRSSRPSP